VEGQKSGIPPNLHSNRIVSLLTVIEAASSSEGLGCVLAGERFFQVLIEQVVHEMAAGQDELLSMVSVIERKRNKVNETMLIPGRGQFNFIETPAVIQCREKQ
jgi:hypothetical protein